MSLMSGFPTRSRTQAGAPASPCDNRAILFELLRVVRRRRCGRGPRRAVRLPLIVLSEAGEQERHLVYVADDGFGAGLRERAALHLDRRVTKLAPGPRPLLARDDFIMAAKLDRIAADSTAPGAG